jgi:DNA-binding transcriptional ArsR family regulator
MVRKRTPPLSVPDAAQLFRLFGSPARLRLLLLLRDGGEMGVGDLVAAAGQDRRTVGGHLTLLRLGGVVGRRQAGRRSFYRVASPWVAEVLRDVGEG